MTFNEVTGAFSFYIMNITEVEELEKTEPMSMDWKGHTVNFEAKTASLTPQFLKDAGDLISYPRAIVTVVDKWDVTKDAKGTPWPLEEDELAKLPVPFLTAMLNKVAESWSGDQKKVEGSPNGSAAAAK